MAAGVQVVVLAAGFGSRLGMPFPKPLTPLVSGRTILARQLDGVRAVFGADVPVIVVVGFKLELIMEAHPDVLYAYNERYDQTNTAKSLLRALRLAGPGGVLWMNGDVVFDPAILQAVAPHIAAGESFVCVNTAAVGEEEIKYTVDADGMVLALSKTVRDGLGEAIGINYVGPADKDLLIQHLDACADNDYFERGLETAIAAGLRVRPVDISRFYAVEVDFEADLKRANEVTREREASAPGSDQRG
jgi:CDP-glycerol glycerophosphotransferase